MQKGLSWAIKLDRASGQICRWETRLQKLWSDLSQKKPARQKWTTIWHTVSVESPGQAASAMFKILKSGTRKISKDVERAFAESRVHLEHGPVLSCLMTARILD